MKYERDGERLEFFGRLLAEISLERRERRELNWSEESLLFLMNSLQEQLGWEKEG